MGNHFKAGLFCLLFALAVVTSYAEPPEVAAKDNGEVAIPEGNEFSEDFSYSDEFEDSSARLKRDLSRDWRHGNPLRPRARFNDGRNGQQGGNPQAGRGRGGPPQAGRGRGGPPRGGPTQLPVDYAQARRQQRQQAAAELRAIQMDLSEAMRFYIRQGMTPEAARSRAERENPNLMARIYRLRQRDRRPSL